MRNRKDNTCQTKDAKKDLAEVMGAEEEATEEEGADMEAEEVEVAAGEATVVGEDLEAAVATEASKGIEARYL